jgi:hypothetical protein
VISCPNCGWSNPADARFCEHCGADIAAVAKEETIRPAPDQDQQQTAPYPQPYTPQTHQAPDWRMSGLPQAPPPKERRTWLWILIIMLSLLLLCCCAVAVWASTSGGEDTLQRWGTSISNWATEQSESN